MLITKFTRMYRRRVSFFGRLGFSKATSSQPASLAAAEPSARIGKQAQSTPVSNSENNSPATSRNIPAFQITHNSTSLSSFPTQHLNAHPRTLDLHRNPGPGHNAYNDQTISNSTVLRENLSGLSSRLGRSASSNRGEYLASGYDSINKSRYIKTRLKNKSKRDFNYIFLAQELRPHTPLPSPSTGKPFLASLPLTISPSRAGSSQPSDNIQYAGASSTSPSATWTLKFSPDGQYLASAGADGVVRVWQILSSPEDRDIAIDAMTTSLASSTGHEPTWSGSATLDVAKHLNSMKESTKRTAKPMLAFPIFAHEPLHEWHGHTSDILDLSWSKVRLCIRKSVDEVGEG